MHAIRSVEIERRSEGSFAAYVLADTENGEARLEMDISRRSGSFYVFPGAAYYAPGCSEFFERDSLALVWEPSQPEECDRIDAAADEDIAEWAASSLFERIEAIESGDERGDCDPPEEDR